MQRWRGGVPDGRGDQVGAALARERRESPRMDRALSQHPASASRQSKPTPGVIVARLGLVVVAVALAICFAEALLRVVPDSAEARADPSVPDDTLWADRDWQTPPAKVFRRDPVLGYDNAPSARADVRAAEHAGGAFRFQTDNYGLR